ncbi:MAG: autoinducer binding domain-containing protein, partial [Rhizobacter sp.]
MLLQGGFTSVLQAKNRDELLAEVVGFTRRLGFETVNATAVVDRFRGESDFVWVNNAPSAYRNLSEKADEGRRDPVGQHCKKASVPIIWNQDTYTSVG